MKVIVIVAILSYSFINAQGVALDSIYPQSILNSHISYKDEDIDFKEVLIIVYENDEDFKYPNRKQKRVRSAERKNKKRNDYYYYYYFNKADRIQISYREFEDFDQELKNNPEPYFKINKSFLRKNKDIIFTKKEMLKIGYEKMCRILDRAKNLFLIDLSESSKNRILIKEVHYFSNYNE